MASVWGELKRRNVVKVAVAYAIVRWLFMCVAALSVVTGCTPGSGGTSSSSPEAAAGGGAQGPTISRAEGARFLTRATFGATDPDIDALVTLGYETWLDDQFSMPPTLQLPELDSVLAADDLLTNVNQQVNARRLRRMDVWWNTVVYGRDQLRQRVAFALSQIFVISDVESALRNSVQGIANYNDLLAEHAFSNYRELLEAVTLNPMMGDFLSMRRNEKADPARNIRPDENYAREVMQLFSIGLWELNLDGTRKLDANGQPIPTFSYYEILSFARVYTGWNYGNAPRLQFDRKTPQSEVIPMRSFENFHDRELKILLGGTVVPAGLDAPDDIDAALDSIFNHPNVAPFISRQLIQHLVTSNPSPTYVERVAGIFEDNGTGVRGDLRAVIKAILLDPAVIEASSTDGFTFGKLKDPILRVTQLWRAFDARGALGVLRYGNSDQDMGQRTLGAPSVFNFFRPDYKHPGEIQDMGLDSPAFQILTETLITSTTNRMGDFVFSRAARTGANSVRHQIFFDLGDEIRLAPEPPMLVDHLNTLLMGGTMSAQMEQTLVNHVASTSLNDDGTQRVQEAIFLIVTSPEFAVER